MSVTQIPGFISDQSPYAVAQAHVHTQEQAARILKRIGIVCNKARGHVEDWGKKFHRWESGVVYFMNEDLQVAQWDREGQVLVIFREPQQWGPSMMEAYPIQVVLDGTSLVAS